ncbi:MAG: hypothetical protein ABJH98_18125 [Reichenbachiella sp.]|uniref:hypothetical protein n=1 Tax=Reichenbachiella sp. TaxID=2184521 RepID=UPI0032989436
MNYPIATVKKEYDGVHLNIENGGRALRTEVFRSIRASYKKHRPPKALHLEIKERILDFQYLDIKIVHNHRGFVVTCADKTLRAKLSRLFNQMRTYGSAKNDSKLKFISAIYDYFLDEMDLQIRKDMMQVKALSKLDLSKVDVVNYHNGNKDEDYGMHLGQLRVQRIYKHNIFKTKEARGKYLGKYVWDQIENQYAACCYYLFGNAFTIGQYNYVVKNYALLCQLREENKQLFLLIAAFYNKKGFKLTSAIYHHIKKHLIGQGVSHQQWKKIVHGQYHHTNIKRMANSRKMKKPSQYLTFLDQSTNLKSTAIEQVKDYFERYSDQGAFEDERIYNNFMILFCLFNNSVRKSWSVIKQTRIINQHIHTLLDYVNHNAIVLTTKHKLANLIERSELWHDQRILQRDLHGFEPDLQFYQGVQHSYQINQVEFNLLNTPKTLIKEGIQMKHCVGNRTFVYNSINQDIMLFHVDYPEGTATLELYALRSNNNVIWKQGQFYGPYNSMIEERHVLTACKHLIKQLNQRQLSKAS